MTRTFKVTVWVFLVVLSLLAAACGSDGDSSSNGNGDGSNGQGGVDKPLFIAIDSYPTTMDPQLRDDGGSRAVVNNIFESLLGRNGQTAQLEPLLAVELPEEVDDNTWRFKLRDDVTFTNGEPFNADAVVANIERVLDPGLASEQLGFYEGVGGAETVDEFTVDIKTKTYDPVLPARMAFFKMVPPEYADTPEFLKEPVGTGPYLFKSAIAGESVELEKNPDYWGEEPVISNATYRVIEDDTTRLAALQSGEVQLVGNLPPEFADSVPVFKSIPGAENLNIILNLKEPDAVTSDVRVRQALNLAIDKEAIAEEIFSGYATVLKGQTVPPQAFGHNPDLAPYPYDPAQAKALIEEAGATGATLRFVGLAGRWLKSREVCQFVVASLEQIGLKIKYTEREFDGYLTDLSAKSNKPEMIYHSSSNDLLDADRQIASYFISTSPYSAVDDTLDELAAAARSERDQDKRLALYADLLQQARDNATHIFLVQLDDTYGVAKDLVWEPRADQQLFVSEMSFIK